MSSTFYNAEMEKPLSHFHKFGKLPKQIQFKIWDLACCTAQPRVIELVQKSKRNDIQGRKGLGAISKAPELFHACQDSRFMAKKYYQFILHDTLHGFPVIINFKLDTIRIPTVNDFKAFFQGSSATDSSTTSELRFLELHIQNLRYGADGMFVFPTMSSLMRIRRFKNLKLLILKPVTGRKRYSQASAKRVLLDQNGSRSGGRFSGNRYSLTEEMIHFHEWA